MLQTEIYWYLWHYSICHVQHMAILNVLLRVRSSLYERSSSSHASARTLWTVPKVARWARRRSRSRSASLLCVELCPRGKSWRWHAEKGRNLPRTQLCCLADYEEHRADGAVSFGGGWEGKTGAVLRRWAAAVFAWQLWSGGAGERNTSELAFFRAPI